MSNQACWQQEAKAKVVLGPSDFYTPGPGEILVKNKYIAISPIDYKDQRYTIHEKPFPTILGTSLAGIVEAVGPNVTSFAPNGRVAVNRSDKTLGDSRYGTFQEYVIASVNMTAKLAPEASLEAAAATVINLATMFSALSIHLKLDRPPMPEALPPNPENKKFKLLLYGGSSSCGGLGTKYASDAGYTVVTTSSPRNRGFVAKLGAAHVVDHHRPAEEVIEQLRKHGPYDAVVDCISLPETFGITEKLVPEKTGILFGLLPDMGYTFPSKVEFKFFPYSWALEQESNAHLARWFYDEYLPQGLASGQIVPTRHATREGGLKEVQETLDKLADKGISGKKFLVAL